MPVSDPFAVRPARFPCTPGTDPRFVPSSAEVIRPDWGSGHKPVPVAVDRVHAVNAVVDGRIHAGEVHSLQMQL